MQSNRPFDQTGSALNRMVNGLNNADVSQIHGGDEFVINFPMSVTTNAEDKHCDRLVRKNIPNKERVNGRKNSIMVKGKH